MAHYFDLVEILSPDIDRVRGGALCSSFYFSGQHRVLFLRSSHQRDHLLPLPNRFPRSPFLSHTFNLFQVILKFRDFEVDVQSANCGMELVGVVRKAIQAMTYVRRPFFVFL